MCAVTMPVRLTVLAVNKAGAKCGTTLKIRMVEEDSRVDDVGIRALAGFRVVHIFCATWLGVGDARQPPRRIGLCHERVDADFCIRLNVCNLCCARQSYTKAFETCVLSG